MQRSSILHKTKQNFRSHLTTGVRMVNTFTHLGLKKVGAVRTEISVCIFCFSEVYGY